MTLLKFIEYQRRDTFLNRVPILLKLGVLIYALCSLLLPLPMYYIIYSLILIIILLTMLLIVAFKDLIYIGEIYATYFSLFAIAYFTSVIMPVNLEFLLIRLLYLYTVAISSIFLFATTKVKDLEAFLLRIGIPKKILNFFVITWNLIPSTYQELQMVIIAQRARGVEMRKNPISKIKNSIIILVPFLYLLLLRSRLLETSLKARGIE